MSTSTCRTRPRPSSFEDLDSRPLKRARKHAPFVYDEKPSAEKAHVNTEFTAWATHEYEQGSGHRVLVLDGPGMGTTRALVDAGIAPADITVIEGDRSTFAAHKAAVTNPDSRVCGVSQEFGDVFVHLQSSVNNGTRPRVAFLDLMCSNVTDQDLLMVQAWERSFGDQEYHACFVTLSSRAPDGQSIDAREQRIVDALARGTFGHHMTWCYKRDAQSQMMLVFMLGTDAPAQPAYRPHQVRQRIGDQCLVKFWGSDKLFLVHKDDSSIQELV